MVPDTSELYDDAVRRRMRWALREAVVVAGIALFWLAIAVAVTVVVSLLSLPFLLVGGGPLGASVATAVWGVVGPLATTTATLYLLARVGVLLFDRYQEGSTEAHPLGEHPEDGPTGATAETDDGGEKGTAGGVDEESAGAGADEATSEGGVEEATDAGDEGGEDAEPAGDDGEASG